MDDFLSMIEKNAVGSREEPGCIRFGMLIVVFDGDGCWCRWSVCLCETVHQCTRMPYIITQHTLTLSSFNCATTATIKQSINQTNHNRRPPI